MSSEAISKPISAFLAGKYLIECLNISIDLSKEDRLVKTINQNSVDANGYLSPSISIIYIRGLIQNDIDVYIQNVNMLMKNYEIYLDELKKSKSKAVKYKSDSEFKQANLELEAFENNEVIGYFTSNTNTSLSVDKIYNNKFNALTKKNPMINLTTKTTFNNLSDSEQKKYVDSAIIKEYTAKNKTINDTIEDNKIELEFEYEDKVDEIIRKSTNSELITIENIYANVNTIVNGYVATFKDIFNGFLINYINNKLVIINNVDLKKLRKNPEISNNMAGFNSNFQEIFRVNKEQIDYLLSIDKTTKNILGIKNPIETTLFKYMMDYKYYTGNEVKSNEKDENWFERVGNTGIESINQVVEDLNIYIEKFNKYIKLKAINIVSAYYKGVFSLRLLSMDKVTKSMSKLPSAEFLDAFKKEIQAIVDGVLDKIIWFLSSIKSVIESLSSLVELIMLTSVKGIDIPTDVINHISFCPNLFDPTDAVVKASYASVMIAIETLKCLAFEELDIEDTCEQVEEDLKKVAAHIIGILNTDFDYYEWRNKLKSNKEEAYADLDTIIKNLTQDQLFGNVQEVVDSIFDVIMALILATIITLVVSMIILMIYKILTGLGKFIPYMLSIGMIYVAYKLFYNCNEFYIGKWNEFYNTYHGYIDNNTEILDYIDDGYGAKITYIDSVNDMVNGKYKSISSYTNKFKKIIKRYGFEISDRPSTLDLSKGAIIVNSYVLIEDAITNIFTLSTNTKAILNQIENLSQSSILVSITRSSVDEIVDNNDEWSEGLFSTGNIFGLDKEYIFDIYKAKGNDDRDSAIKAGYLNYINSLQDDISPADISNAIRPYFGIEIMSDCVASPDSIFNPLDYTKHCQENLSDLNSDLLDDEVYESYYCQKQENGTYYCVDVKTVDDPGEDDEPSGCFLQATKKVFTDMATVEDESSLVFSLNIMEFFGIDKVLEIISLWTETKEEVNKIIRSIYEKLNCYLNKLNNYSCDIFDEDEDEDEITVDPNPFLDDLSFDFGDLNVGKVPCGTSTQVEVWNQLVAMSDRVLNNEFEQYDEATEIKNLIAMNNQLELDQSSGIEQTKAIVKDKSYTIEGEQYEKVKVYSNDLDERTEQMGRKMYGGGPENNTLDDDGETEIKAGAYWNRKIYNGLPINPFGYGNGSKKYSSYFTDGNILSKYHNKWKDANSNNKFYGEQVNVSKKLGGFDKQIIFLELLMGLILRTPWEMVLFNNWPDTETFFFLMNFISMPISWEKVRAYILQYKKGDEEKVSKNKVGLSDYLNELIQGDISDIKSSTLATNGTSINDLGKEVCPIEDAEDPCPNSDLSIKEKYKQGLITTCDTLNPNNAVELLDAILDDPDLNKIQTLIAGVISSHPISEKILPYNDGSDLSDKNLVVVLSSEEEIYCI